MRHEIPTGSNSPASVGGEIAPQHRESGIRLDGDNPALRVTGNEVGGGVADIGSAINDEPDFRCRPDTVLVRNEDLIEDIEVTNRAVRTSDASTTRADPKDGTGFRPMSPCSNTRRRARHPSTRDEATIVFHLDLGLNHSLTFVAKLIEKTTTARITVSLRQGTPTPFLALMGAIASNTNPLKNNIIMILPHPKSRRNMAKSLNL